MQSEPLQEVEIGEALQVFETQEPHIVFEWRDTETEARGWVVINSLTGGAAGGGTRMRPGLDRHEVVSLAKTMEIKFKWCGPVIGGAKSGIDFDPTDERKGEVLRRWYQAVLPLLKTYYGTGGDLNVDEIREVFPITEPLGLLHPQEGVLRGHYHPDDVTTQRVIEQMRYGVKKEIRTPRYAPQNGPRIYTIADMVTGWGVAEAVRAYYQQRREYLEGKRVLVQGWGVVAAAAAWYLSQHGTKVVGILDRNSGLIDEDGMDETTVRALFNGRNGNQLAGGNLLGYEEANTRFWDTPADIFLPSAASRLVTREHLDRLQQAGVEVISCGANVPFADEAIFYGPVARYADEHFSVVPDFLANCGMARAFAYFMQPRAEMADEAIFNDISRTIFEGIHILLQEGQRGLVERGFRISLERIAHPEAVSRFESRP
jgi:glutamate dehydrogenase/leucine dehydrogenase